MVQFYNHPFFDNFYNMYKTIQFWMSIHSILDDSSHPFLNDVTKMTYFSLDQILNAGKIE